MSSSTSPNGRVDGPEDVLEPGVEPVRRMDGRRIRALLGGAAGVAVIGSGALAFVWLTSAPSGASGFTTGTPVTHATTTTEPSATASRPAFVLAGRDIFAPTVAPSSSKALTAEDVQNVVDELSSAGGTSATAASAAPSASKPTAAGVTTGAPTHLPTSVPTKPVSRAPVSPVPGTATAVTPTPSASTAPAWEMAEYTFTGTDANDASSGNFTIAPSAVNIDYLVKVVPGDKLYPAPITFRGEFSSGAWITSDRGVVQGWIVPVGAAVPNAAMGKTSGTVRVVDQFNSKQFHLQVDRGPSVLVKIGEKVPGTPFTLVAPKYDGIDLPEEVVAFTDAAGVTYYGAAGAGETDGVTF